MPSVFSLFLLPDLSLLWMLGFCFSATLSLLSLGFLTAPAFFYFSVLHTTVSTSPLSYLFCYLPIYCSQHYCYWFHYPCILVERLLPCCSLLSFLLFFFSFPFVFSFPFLSLFFLFLFFLLLSSFLYFFFPVFFLPLIC